MGRNPPSSEQNKFSEVADLGTKHSLRYYIATLSRRVKARGNGSTFKVNGNNFAQKWSHVKSQTYRGQCHRNFADDDYDDDDDDKRISFIAA